MCPLQRAFQAKEQELKQGIMKLLAGLRKPQTCSHKWYAQQVSPRPTHLLENTVSWMKEHMNERRKDSGEEHRLWSQCWGAY